MDDTFRDRLQHDLHRRLYDYWLSIRPPDGLPGRIDFHPEEVPSLLPYIYLRDIVRSEGNIRFRTRLMGTKLVQILGRDTTGKFMEDIFGVEYLARQRVIYLDVIESREPDLRMIRAPVPNRDYVRYDRLLLPMATDGKCVDLLLGMLVFVR